MFTLFYVLTLLYYIYRPWELKNPKGKHKNIVILNIFKIFPFLDRGLMHVENNK